ncbi:MAG: hypothetical protein LBB81_01340 [Treponema sp.]|jgi:50S ribosomal subunit-associated GTPase HflX|nr:hypothetical protein [Treponema sp.]
MNNYCHLLAYASRAETLYGKAAIELTRLNYPVGDRKAQASADKRSGQGIARWGSEGAQE